MEKIENKVISKSKKIHQIYCDICGGFISEEHEYDDGYYRDHMYSLTVYTDGTYICEKQLCDKCRNTMISDFNQLLTNFGFKPQRME